MTHIHIDAIEARLKAATPGDWEYEGIINEHRETGFLVFSETEPDIYHEIVHRYGDESNRANFVFIGNAHQDVSDLIARVRELEQVVAQLVGDVRTVADDYTDATARIAELERVRCPGCLAQAARAENAEKKVAELEEYWVERTIADDACEEHRREHEAMVEKARAEAVHARRSIKQACLFAAESVTMAVLSEDDPIGRGYNAGVRAAADAVAQVEVD